MDHDGETVDQYATRCGELLAHALHIGGDALLDKAEASLGVALRHIDRVREGQLPFVPGVRAEIKDSILRTENLLAAYAEDR